MTFEDIYRTNAWQGEESLSGPGSGSAATRQVIPWIRMLIQQEVILSVLDIGCGDGFWMPDLTVRYTGIDPSQTAIDRARARHEDAGRTPGRWRYIVADAAKVPLEHHELVIVRDVFQHLSFAEGRALLDNLWTAQPFFLLASTYPGRTNRDIRTGDSYTPDLTKTPFNLPQPELLIFDGYYYHDHDTDQVRDPTKYLGLWRRPLTKP